MRKGEKRWIPHIPSCLSFITMYHMYEIEQNNAVVTWLTYTPQTYRDNEFFLTFITESYSEQQRRYSARRHGQLKLLCQFRNCLSSIRNVVFKQEELKESKSRLSDTERKGKSITTLLQLQSWMAMCPGRQFVKKQLWIIKEC